MQVVVICNGWIKATGLLFVRDVSPLIQKPSLGLLFRCGVYLWVFSLAVVNSTVLLHRMVNETNVLLTKHLFSDKPATYGTTTFHVLFQSSGMGVMTRFLLAQAPFVDALFVRAFPMRVCGGDVLCFVLGGSDNPLACDPVGDGSQREATDLCVSVFWIPQHWGLRLSRPKWQRVLFDVFPSLLSVHRVEVFSKQNLL